ncbi:MAG: NigD-like protein [Candidatus Cryptobacteroides sp.]
MKKSIIAMMIAAAFSAAAFTSCTGSDDNCNEKAFANAMVTVRTSGAGDVYFMLTDDKALVPVNIKAHPFDGKTVRAYANLDEQEEGKVYVNWIDSVLTKQPVADQGEDNWTAYGSDPVDIVNSWETVAEDGFLTIRFRTVWGGLAKHEVNLVTGSDPEDPYKVIFCHNAHGDVAGRVGDGIVAFDLSSLPYTGDEPVKLTLVWKSSTGERTASMNFRSHDPDIFNLYTSAQ